MIKNKQLIDSINSYGDVIVGVNSIIDSMLSGQDIDNVYVDDSSELKDYYESCKRFDTKPYKLNEKPKYNQSPDEYLRDKSKIWFIPKEYFEIDIVTELSKRCKNSDEKKRLAIELQEFYQRDQVKVLYALLYLVDVMRKNNIVWGIGRGSSVASFVLYLIGINKINPMEYGLEHTEFFKPQE